ncbi:ATP-grasp domain-containing protein [Catelliglobosispora koreensis]|uniref:ATP-grasp domain-containing protein n=1 Tax=Catelliglobosispora koreensis TaxID=129052 RepID=UPI00037081B3|nr:ATP-grasp domain-containing protein [Catelliglobosispora koreensis]
MTTTRVLLLEAAGPESHAIATTAAARGYEVFTVTSRERWDGYDTALRNLLTGHLLTDFSSSDQAAKAVVAYARLIKVSAVLTTNEYLTPLCALAAADLGLPGNDPSLALAARNKAQMAARFAAYYVPAPRTLVLDGGCNVEDQIHAAGLSFPVVVKPSEGAGSGGVTIVDWPKALAGAVLDANGQRSMYGALLDGRVLIQEYANGQEYSVESITQDGRTSHLCLTRKLVSEGSNRVEIGHMLPADEDADSTAIFDAASQAIASVGIRNGATHTEVILTPTGECKVVEVAARIAAGNIGHLIRHATGVDPWAACLDVALGRPMQLQRTSDCFATVRFLSANRSGRLVAIHGLPKVSSEIPFVRVRATAGTRVAPPRSNSDRLGCFAVVGNNASDVERRANDLLADIRIEVEPVAKAGDA